MWKNLHIISLLLALILIVSEANSQPCPPINAGSDVSICPGDSTQLNAKDGQNYTWSPATGLSNTSINNPIAKPTVTTTYTVSSFVPGGIGPNIIVNGDFEQGNTGFTSSYSLCTNPGNCDNDTYIIGTNGSAHHSQWKCTDHTSGSGNYMILDGATSANVNVWCQTVNVTPNITYDFSCWGVAMGDYYGDCSGDLHFIFNGTDIGHLVIPPSFSCPWTQGTATWNSGNNTSVNICIVDACTNFGGNDFGIDDISLKANMPPCLSKDSVVVTVNPIPIVSITPDSASICTGKNISLTAAGATNYTWSPSTGLDTTEGSTVTANPDTTTIYTITGESKGCTGDTTVIVTVKPNPVVTVSPDSTAICAKSSVSLAATGATNYTWAPAAGLNNTTDSTVTASPGSTTNYIVTGETEGCIATDTALVIVKPNPIVSVKPVSIIICPGDTTILTASGSATYTWTPSAGLDTTGGRVVNAVPAVSTTYTVTGFTNGCSDSASADIIINPLIPVKVSPTAISICIGDSTVLSASGATTYTWNPSAGLSSSTSENVTAKPASTTTYIVTGKTRGCSGNDTAIVTVNPIPTITISPDSISICPDNNVSLTANGASEYTWAPSSGLNSTIGSMVNASPSNSITYTVTGTDKGCSASTSVAVYIKQISSDLYVPSGFTPNGDDINDVFKVVFSPKTRIENFDCKIFNRWGNKIYEWENVNNGWDGTYNGTKAMEGVYVYVIKAIDNCNNKFTKYGTITLLK